MTELVAGPPALNLVHPEHAFEASLSRQMKKYGGEIYVEHGGAGPIRCPGAPLRNSYLYLELSLNESPPFALLLIVDTLRCLSPEFVLLPLTGVRSLSEEKSRCPTSCSRRMSRFERTANA
jgi:hypothetical protein